MKKKLLVILLLVIKCLNISGAARFEHSQELLKKRYNGLVEELNILRQRGGSERFQGLIQAIETQLANLPDILVSHSDLDEISAMIFRLEQEFNNYFSASGPLERDKIAKKLDEFIRKSKAQKYITGYKVKTANPAQQAKKVLFKEHQMNKDVLGIIYEYTKNELPNDDDQIKADIDLVLNLPKDAKALVGQYARNFTSQEIYAANSLFDEAYEKLMIHHRNQYLQSLFGTFGNRYMMLSGLAVGPIIDLHAWLKKAEKAIINGAEIKITPYNVLFLQINDILNYPNLLALYQSQKQIYALNIHQSYI